jgi:hypothetical protein
MSNDPRGPMPALHMSRGADATHHRCCVRDEVFDGIVRSMTISDGASGDFDHEEVRIVRDDASGLVAVIAVHSTVLGPAMGGVRRTSYGQMGAALSDALQLARAMTLKNSAAPICP